VIRLALLVATLAILPAVPSTAGAQTVTTTSELKHYNVTIRRFDPARPASAQEFVLPVDSPDEEHAIASTIANAASWAGKVADGRPLPVAFMAVRVAPR
jgi:hypothetical protein